MTASRILLAALVAGGLAMLAVAPRPVKIPAGGIPPAWCDVGELWLDTDEAVDTNCTTTADNSICACHTLNTWETTE